MYTLEWNMEPYIRLHSHKYYPSKMQQSDIKLCDWNKMCAFARVRLRARARVCVCVCVCVRACVCETQRERKKE